MLSTKGIRHTKINEQSAPKEGSDLTPNWLFGEFRKDTEESDFGWIYGYKAIDGFKALEDKDSFLKPTIDFVSKEKNDRVRSWAIYVLELIGGNEAYNTIVHMLKTETADKRKYVFTRFFALRAIANLASFPGNEKEALLAILKDMSEDRDEDYLAQAGASVILTQPQLQELVDAEDRQRATAKVKGMLNAWDDTKKGNDSDAYWASKRALRALQEFPIRQLVHDIIEIVKKEPKRHAAQHKRAAIQSLGSYNDPPRSDDDDDRLPKLCS
jgi:HEAT repeat protein